MAMSLDGKRVVVIGGASGIGFGIAKLAAEHGATVVIGSSKEANVTAAVAKLKDATGYTVDVRDEASVQAFFAKVGAFDHLAFTAGDWDFQTVSAKDIDLAKARANLDVRLWGAVAAIKHAVGTIAKDGSITLTSGMLVHRPRKGAPLVGAIGGATESLAKSFAADLAPVRVNAVCPGLVLTEHVEKSYPQQQRDAVVGGQPLPRTATVEEAAMAYVYAMMNGYVTGQTLPIDGGGLLV
ncbi:MAG TPA: SDR family oxidoreductase [Kofleriaceae bacterium]|jgi:NAD(P)-dependent dehydrogenase (short-subunit alcohol dehydrogenase family)